MALCIMWFGALQAPCRKLHDDQSYDPACRKQKLEEAEQRRLAAEEEMEARRLELIKEGGYWKNRMAQDEKTQALQEESIIKAGTQVSALRCLEATKVFDLLFTLQNSLSDPSINSQGALEFFSRKQL